MNITQAKEILKHQFGFDSFRMNQEAAIEAVLNKRDCVVLMPTGGGKSLCYQIPALMLDGLTVIISPLIALMKDQVDALRNNGIEAAFLNSTQTNREQVEVFQAIRTGRLKLLYVAPERLLQSGNQFIDFLKSVNVSLFAIDEAHCISSWGHDFRPEYIQLGALKRYFPEIPVIALTATADKLVRKDIVERLNIRNAEIFVSSFNRPNIHYRVEPKRNSYAQLLDYLEKRRDESGIIYCLSRNSVENLAEDLRDEGFDALPYHAGLDKETRDRHQELFLKDEVKIIVATIAFGMGIDKSNVRFVAHLDLPKNVESYYQETGRAGRDGLQSEALLFFSWADVKKLKDFAAVENNQQQTEIMLRKLTLMGAFGDLKTCRRKFLLNYFGEELAEDCGNCDNCRKEFERFDGTIIAQKALSAVYRTGQRFGVNYLIDFLRGSQSKKIWEEHRWLKTFGVGADVSKQNWFDYFNDLIAQGYLAQADKDNYSIIVLTEKSWGVLRGEERVELIKVTEKEEKKDRKTSLLPETTHEYFKDLFNHLRQVRTAFAREENVPPYVVFSDATLVEMATFLPQTEAEMRQISGVGDLKMEKYGADFLQVIKNYCGENGLESRIDLKTPKRERKNRTKKDASGNDTYSISYKLFRSGLSVAEIAREREMATSTIENHLVRFVSSGEIELDELVPANKIEPIRNAIIKFSDSNAISPVKEFLGEGYSYMEIKAVLADFLKTGAQAANSR
ncbi:MAG TPA: DNA helicase RecQ [Pyrinomonadaceae bacterium]|nr:DNA helicase RecQ [Pyrinomonadaceae bacterium]